MKKKNILIIFSVVMLVIILFFIFKGGVTGSTDIKRPNIILITIEALRTDHMSTYGYERETTPNIDELAKEGIVFTNHIGISGDSGASLASLFTSKYPASHGVHTIGTSVKSNENTLTEVLKDEGYATFGIVPFFALGKLAETNYDQGFDMYADPRLLGPTDTGVILYDVFETLLFEAFIRRYKESVNETQIINGLSNLFSSLVIETNELINVVSFLKESKPLFEELISGYKGGKKEGKPFFIWVHFWGAHAPYRGIQHPYSHPNTEPFAKNYIKKGTDITDPNNPSMKSNIHEHSKWINITLKGKKITELDVFKALYDECIHSTDQYIGDMIKVLNHGNVLNNTIVIISSDHGEALGEEGIFFLHGHSTKDYMLNLPLIIYYPEKLEHKLINYQTSGLDMMPTILDLVGIDKSDLDLQGKNLLEEETEFVFLETMFCNNDITPKCYPNGKDGQQKAIRSNKYKLIMTPTKEGKVYRLFDLEKDPQELNNIYNENDKISKFLKKKLDDWIDQGQEYRNRGDEMSDAVRENLKSLGYIM